MTDLNSIYGPTLTSGLGLPGDTFTSETLFRQEMSRVFHRSWCCIGLVQDVGKLRQVFPVEFLKQPLLLVHNHNGIEVFHNVCSHRGALLVGEAKSLGPQGKLICPYHSWTYGLDGALLRTPHAGGVGVHDDNAIDRSTCGLKRVRSAVWHDLVFVNLSCDAPPFEDFIAPLAERTAFLKGKKLYHDAHLAQSATPQANWKILVENFVESYHLPPVHAELQSVNPMAWHYQVLGGSSFVGQGGDGRDWQKSGSESDLPARPAGRFAKVSEYEVFWLYPNLIFQPIGNLCAVMILFPQSAVSTHERMEFFFYDGTALEERHEAERRRQVEFLVQINTEDIGICERTQLGRASLGFTGGIFCMRQEKSSARVQQIIASRMVSGALHPSARREEFSFEDIRHPEVAESKS